MPPFTLLPFRFFLLFIISMLHAGFFPGSRLYDAFMLTAMSYELIPVLFILCELYFLCIANRAAPVFRELIEGNLLRFFFILETAY